MDEPFARLLRRFRARAGLTLSELAEALGAARSSVRAWEQGRRVPRDRARLADLAQVLQLSPTEASALAAAARGHSDPRVALAPQTETEAQAITSSTVTGVPLTTHHLRAPIGDFVGRSLEIATLRDALLQALQNGGAAICGVQGMGGIGKTELAYQVAHELRVAFPDAQIVIELRGASPTPLTPVQALQTVVHAFVPDARLTDDLTHLQQRCHSLLHDRHVLLLADDARDAAQVRPLLPPAGCALLLTSRSRFSLPGMTSLDLGYLGDEEAIGLLRAICPRLTIAEAQQLAAACGYLPLALRVSGSLLHNDPTLSASDYLAHLADDQRRLSALRDPDDPFLDVAATLALSYDLLDQPAQAVFRQLGVFVADFTSEMAQAVVEVEPGTAVTDVLRTLLRRNLLQYDTACRRWRLHDLVRDLARQRLEAAQAEPTSWRYARAVVQTAQDIQEQYLEGGKMTLLALARFDAERPHIDATHHWAQRQAQTPEGDHLLLEAARATVYIGWLRYDPHNERIPLWKRALAAAQRLGDRHAEGQTLNPLGIAYQELGQMQQAISYFEQRLTIARMTGDLLGEGHALTNIGICYKELGHLRRAIPYFEDALSIACAIGDRRNEGTLWGSLGNVYKNLGEARRAILYFEDTIALTRTLGHYRNEGQALNNLGAAYVVLGEVQQAIPYLMQSLHIAHEIGDRRDESLVLRNLGNAYTEQGDSGRAIASYEEALSIMRAVRDRRQEGYTLGYMAHAQALQGAIEQASGTYIQALSLLQEVGDRLGEAECNWLFGLGLAHHGNRERALPLLRAGLAYEQEIGHAKAEEHTALIASLEGGEELPPKRRILLTQQAVGDDLDEAVDL